MAYRTLYGLIMQYQKCTPAHPQLEKPAENLNAWGKWVMGRLLLTLWSSDSTPGMIIIIDTKVPKKRNKVKLRRVMVEFFVDGQQPHRRQGAEPQRHDA